jgi:hypothetical protein
MIAVFCGREKSGQLDVGLTGEIRLECEKIFNRRFLKREIYGLRENKRG